MGGFSAPGDSPRGPAVGQDPRLGAFAQAHPGGLLRPGAGLAVTLDEVSGPDRRCAGRADCKTWMALQRLVALAVCTVDPDGARKRREYAEREHARVRFWRETSGAAGLAGYSLPADETLAANASVEARAQCYRQAGIIERIDKLRVLAFLDLLNCVPSHDRVTRWKADQADQADQAARAADAAPRTAPEPAPEAPDTRTSRGDHATAGETGGGRDDAGGDGVESGWPNEEWPSDDAPDDGEGGTGGGDGNPCPGLPALPALVNLTLPLVTQMRLAERPGEAWGLGALDPELVRGLAEAAARSPHSRFCVTIVSDQGHAVAHRCCKRARPARRGHQARERRRPGQPPADPASPRAGSRDRPAASARGSSRCPQRPRRSPWTCTRSRWGNATTGMSRPAMIRVTGSGT